MSYIVSKGIPKSCEQCDIKPEKCPAIAAKVSSMDEDLWIPLNYRHDDCPLIEIKSPHGRLIDADKLEKGFKRAIGTYLPKDPTRHMNIVDGSECRGWTQALTAVQKAETVIEAEG